MKDYSTALIYFERTRIIWQRTLTEDHPYLKEVQKSIDIVKQKLH